jgi:hypothetical protein
MLYPFVKTKKCEEENISVLGKYWYQNDPSFDTGIYFLYFSESLSAETKQRGLIMRLDSFMVSVDWFSLPFQGF